MLTKHLSFASEDVELLYFDVEPTDGAKLCTKGQTPPTVSNFKSRFTDLVSGAKAGDVRFVYVDARSNMNPAEGSSFEPVNGRDRGWILAAADDGLQEGLIDGEWFTSTIRAVSPCIVIVSLFGTTAELSASTSSPVST